MTLRPIHLVLDDIFFCWADSGIARVWRHVLDEWNEKDLPAKFGIEVTLLNRSGRLDPGGFRQVPFPSRSWDDPYPAADRALLDRICRQLSADVFVSTYYTVPFAVPSLTVVYDLIPEQFGFDSFNRTWIERKLAIALGNRFAVISHSTRNDLLHFHPYVKPSSVGVAHPGIDAGIFSRASNSAISDFREKHGLSRKYIVLPGTRRGANEYKNGRALFDLLRNSSTVDFDVVLTGGEPIADDEAESCARAGARLVRVQLDDTDLATCFSGASAVVYPSLHEGFGLPPLEALAVGTPVVTSDSPSLRESTGELGATFRRGEPDTLAEALALAMSDAWSQSIRARGPEWARTFTWEPFSRLILEQAILAANDPCPLDVPGWGRLLQDYQSVSVVLQ